MDDDRWQKSAFMTVGVAIVLIILPPALVLAGVPVEIVTFFNLLAFVALAIACVVLLVAASRWARWSLVLAGVALAAEIGAALLLNVQEAQPAYLHPEWDWYWPVVNTLYFGGLLACVVTLVGAALNVLTTRSGPAIVAFLIGVSALVINRIAPYR